MLYPCNRYLRYYVSCCLHQNLLRYAYRHPEAVLSLAQVIYCNHRLEETKIFRTDNFKDVYSICMAYCIHKSWMLIKNTSTKYKCVSLSYIQFSLSLLISGNIYISQPNYQFYLQSRFRSLLTSDGFGVAISTAVIRLHDKQRMFRKVNPGRGGLSCLQAGTWSTPALCDVIISRTNKTDMD